MEYTTLEQVKIRLKQFHIETVTNDDDTTSDVVVFDKKEMLDILRRVSLFSSNASNLVEIKKNGMFLTVSANDADFSVSGEDQVCIADAQCDDKFRIGLKSTAFQTCINSIPSDTIRMQLLDPTRAVVIAANEPAPKVLTLCMPMILD